VNRLSTIVSVAAAVLVGSLCFPAAAIAADEPLTTAEATRYYLPGLEIMKGEWTIPRPVKVVTDQG